MMIMGEIREIQNNLPQVQKSGRVNSVTKERTPHNKKQFAQEIDRYLKKKSKKFSLPSKKSLRKQKEKKQTFETEKGQFFDVKV